MVQAPEAIGAMVALFVAAGIFASFTVGSTTSATQVATPVVTIMNPNTREQTNLQYGSEPLLSQPDFFSNTKQAFLQKQETFIEANLDAMMIRYYEDGRMVFERAIQSKGRPGSWWETPAGLYEVQAKKENHRSSFGNVDLPWSIPFQGNFFIHGWPAYPDGTPVASSYSGGCIRLTTEDANALFNQVSVGTPVLVHEPRTVADDFQYEPNLPDMAAPHYLLADVENGTILASSDLEQVVPIASLTKLMTALVAVEYINLDRRVAVDPEAFVESTIPRLEERQTVSMYSLLQLLLLESSNEAAELIAQQLGRDSFVQRMNEKATAIGMRDTVFTDPSGLDDGNVSTLSDLHRLASYIHKNRDFIFKLTADQYTATAYTADEFGELQNFNRFGELDDFYGGKVGYTPTAEQTSLTLHEMAVGSTTRMVAIIVLGSEDRTADALRLHNYFSERFVH
jgi:D-alanyl-D-alanine carboxypeptidase